MENGSRTALMVAALRGRATARDARLCNDPWALPLAGEDGNQHAEAYEREVPDIELWIALRTARLDEATRSAIASGIRQIVILGAGLDTRAARLAHEGVRFFEVDMPGSQRQKLERLRALRGYPIEAATYVETDFERDDFVDRLVAEGFDASLPAFFVWEGVSYYLTESAVRGTLGRIASGTHPASTIVFDYFGARFVKGDGGDSLDRNAREKVAEMGEPLKFGTGDIVAFLYECGYRKVHAETFDEIALNYTGTYERKRKFRFQALAFASRERTVP